MKTSVTHGAGNGTTRAKYPGTVGVALAIACLLITAPLRAEDAHYGDERQQHSQGHAPRQAVRHGNHGRGGYGDGDRGRGGYGYRDQGRGYGYDAPPIVYAPAVAPGISLFLPL